MLRGVPGQGSNNLQDLIITLILPLPSEAEATALAVLFLQNKMGGKENI